MLTLNCLMYRCLIPAMIMQERETRNESKPSRQQLEVELLQALVSGAHPQDVLQQLELTADDATELFSDIKTRLVSYGYGKDVGVEKAISLGVRSGVLEVDTAQVDTGILKKISPQRKRIFKMIGNGLTLEQIKAIPDMSSVNIEEHEQALRLMFDTSKYELVAIAAHLTPTEEPEGRALTARQAEVFNAIAEGLTNAEIARNLGISPKTVEAHRAKVYSNHKQYWMTSRQAKMSSFVSAIESGEVAVEGVPESCYLTDREHEVAGLKFIQGKSNEEVANKLYISVKTVEAHVAHINSKLGAKGYMQALARYTVLQEREGIDTPSAQKEQQRLLEAEARAELMRSPFSSADASLLQGLIDDEGRIMGEKSVQTREFVDRFYGQGTKKSVGLTAAVIKGVSEGSLNPNIGETVPLTRSEVIVANLIVVGRGSVEIASELVCSAKTIDAHKAHIFAKLGAKNTLHLVAILTALDQTVTGIQTKEKIEARQKEELQRQRETLQQEAFSANDVSLLQTLITTRHGYKNTDLRKRSRSFVDKVYGKSISTRIGLVQAVIKGVEEGTLHIDVPDNISSLSTAEKRVAELIKVGRSPKEIASELFLSVKTVEAHASNIYVKLKATNYLHAAGILTAQELS